MHLSMKAKKNPRSLSIQLLDDLTHCCSTEMKCKPKRNLKILLAIQKKKVKF